MNGVDGARVALLASRCANLGSVRRAFEALGARVDPVASAEELAGHARIVFPGVGAFDAGIEAVGEDLLAALRERALDGALVLGICLGQQMLFEGSAEGERVGLGLLPGRVERLRAGPGTKVPHIGWNALRARDPASPLLAGIADGTCFYFVHSYAAPAPEDAAWVSATCTHGEEFAAVVQRGNVFGTQFHPEKSGSAGLRVLRNFLALEPSATGAPA